MNKSRLALIKEEQPLSPRQQRQKILEEGWSPLSQELFELERLERTKKLIKKHVNLSGALVADLGCGSGELARFSRNEGAVVHAVDLSRPALNNLEEEEGIKTFSDFIPRTTLEDSIYDVVICTDVIGELPETDYRLLMNELCRLVKSKGVVICSTGIDLDSDESLPLFIHLANTEFEIEEWVFSYHRLLLKLPLFKKSKLWMRLAESISENLYGEKGVSHALFLGKRKSLF